MNYSPFHNSSPLCSVQGEKVRNYETGCIEKKIVYTEDSYNFFKNKKGQQKYLKYKKKKLPGDYPSTPAMH